MASAFEFPRPIKKAAAQCKTVEEQFDNDGCLGDALALNMDAVRHLRSVIPLESERVCSALYLDNGQARVIADVAISLINQLEDYMVEPVEE